MALLNPIYAIAVPFLCIFTIPLAIFAGITTTLAFSVLMLRVAVVYLDMAVAFIPQYLLGHSGYTALPGVYHHSPDRRGSGSQSPLQISPSSSGGSIGHSSGSPALPFASSAPAYISPTGYRSPRRRTSGPIAVPANVGQGNNALNGSGRRSRRSSQASLGSLGTITPMLIHEASSAASPNLATGGTTTATGSGILPSVGMDRDFEGVGGWRLDDRDNDGDDWANINSRLELPLERIALPAGRHHQRSSSGGGTASVPITPGEGGWLMMKKPVSVRYEKSPDRERNYGASGKLSNSPNSSRVRMSQAVLIPTPLTSRDKEEGYFPPISTSPKSKKSSV